MLKPIPARPYARWADRCGWVVWGSYLGLLLAVTLATLVMPSGERAPNPTVWLLVSVPLLILLPGLWRGRVTTHIWLCFVSLFYFLRGMDGLASYRSALDVIELSLSIVLFCSALLYVRWRSRALRSAAAIREVQDV